MVIELGFDEFNNVKDGFKQIDSKYLDIFLNAKKINNPYFGIGMDDSYYQIDFDMAKEDIIKILNLKNELMTKKIDKYYELEQFFSFVEDYAITSKITI